MGMLSTIENKRLVRKLVGSVPTKFIQIVAAIEQFADLNTMTFQEATERLKAYEERIKRPRKKMYMIDFYTPKQSKRNKKNSIVVNVVVIGSRIRITKEEAAKEIGIKMFCLDAARGLNFLHNGNGKNDTLIHGNIKSSNILISRDGVGMIDDPIDPMLQKEFEKDRASISMREDSIDIFAKIAYPCYAEVEKRLRFSCE
ncbi:zinc finger, CCHC-type containing protein, partial [Tanacetum coccineum]